MKTTKKKNFIQSAIKHPGALHRQIGIKAGKKIPPGTLLRAAQKGGVEGRRARFAETLSHLHHKINPKMKYKEHMKQADMHTKMAKDHKDMAMKYKLMGDTDGMVSNQSMTTPNASKKLAIKTLI